MQSTPKHIYMPISDNGGTVDTFYKMNRDAAYRNYSTNSHKTFNEIEAEISGKIVKVLVDDSSPVDYDQPLFMVEPTA